MSRFLHPLLLLLARTIHSQLIRENEFLKVENQILRSKVKGKIVPTPEERAKLVRFGRELGPAIKNIISIVTPGTFRRWVRAAGGAVIDAIGSRTGRKSKPESTRSLVLRFANENPGWGYQRISGELKKLDIQCCSNTVKKMLIEAGMLPTSGRTTRRFGIRESRGGERARCGRALPRTRVHWALSAYRRFLFRFLLFC